MSYAPFMGAVHYHIERMTAYTDAYSHIHPIALLGYEKRRKKNTPLSPLKKKKKSKR